MIQSEPFSAVPPVHATGKPVPDRPVPPTCPAGPAFFPTRPAGPGRRPHQGTVPRIFPGCASPRGGWPQSHNKPPVFSAGGSGLFPEWLPDVSPGRPRRRRSRPAPPERKGFLPERPRPPARPAMPGTREPAAPLHPRSHPRQKDRKGKIHAPPSASIIAASIGSFPPRKRREEFRTIPAARAAARRHGVFRLPARHSRMREGAGGSRSQAWRIILQ